MNTFFTSWEPAWHTSWQGAGWTMLFFLTLGTLVALIGAAIRFLCNHSTPTVRYSVSLAVFATLALLPAGIAIWLSQSPPTLAASGNAAPTTIDLKQSQIAPPSGWEPATDNKIAANPDPSQPEAGARYALTLPQAIAYLPWLWIAGAPITFALLATGLVGSKRLRRSCTPIASDTVIKTCLHLRESLNITRNVSLALCDRIAQPILVGIVRPLILLPPSALTGWSPDQLEMVLLHELAHVRRCDNLVNLLQRIVESLLFFHPAIWLVSRQVRRDREQCCDAVVVAHTAKPQAYAELLVSIAASHSPSLATASAMADHPLTTRIRRILRLEDEPMLVSRKTLGFFTLLAASIVAIVLWQPAKMSIAEEPGTTVAEEKEATEDVTEHALGLAPVVGENAGINIAIKVPPKFSSPKQHQSIVNSLKKQGYRARVGPFEGLDGEKGFLVVITVPAGSNPKMVWEEHSDGLQPRLILADSTTKVYEPAAYSQPPQEKVSPELRRRELEFELRDAKKRVEFMKMSFQLGQHKFKTGIISEAEILTHKYELDRAELQLERLKARLSDIAEQTSGKKQERTLLYDGKTFDQWREMWKTELKTENRTECINALAAFGRAGHGKEAVEAILDVAGEYDFHMIDGNAEGKLKERVLKVLTERLPTSLWLTSLIEHYDSDTKKWKWLALHLLDRVRMADEQTRQHVLSIANSDHNLRDHAIRALVRNDINLQHPETVEIARKALQGEHPDMSMLHELEYQHLDRVPEQFSLLFHEDISVRNSALRALSYSISHGKPIQAVDMLLEVLDDPAQSKKHVYAIRAFALQQIASKTERERVSSRLLKIAREGDEELLGPAIFALGKIHAGSHDIIIAMSNDSDTPDDRKKLLQNTKAIEELIEQEERIMAPLAGGGFGRGGGGGGGF